MTSRELVFRTLNFKSPSRIARQIWTLPLAQFNHPEKFAQISRDYPDDISGPAFDYKIKPNRHGDPYELGRSVDEWGCVFESIHRGIFGEVKDPILSDLSQWDRIRIPKELLTFNVDQVNAACAKSDKFMLAGCLPRPFERLQFIRGTANLYMDLAMDAPEIMSLLKRIHEFYLEEVIRWCQTAVDGIFFMDDWGSQQALLVSPEMWRRIFKPLYKDYIDTAHKYGKKAFMHSDGYILDIIPDLVEMGVDALNSQIFCMGIDKLKKFAGKITFWGEIDRQRLLNEASLSEVRAAVRQVAETLYADGGVIAQCEFGLGKPENVETVFDEWNRFSQTLKQPNS
jgi:hypothetical protein